MMSVVTGAVWLVSAVPARAQMESREAIALQNQILELRHDIQILSQGGGVQPGYAPRAPSAGGAVAGDLAAQLLQRVSALEEEVRRLRGRVDEIENAESQHYQDLSKQIGDMSFRLQGAAGPGVAAPPPAYQPSAATPPLPVAPPVRRTPEIALQEGNAALARRDYPVAEAAAREVLQNTRGPRSTDAQFLLAQALAGERNYQQAAVAYDDAFKRAPSGAHAQDSLLGIAISLNALGAKKESCQALAQLHASFPTPRPDLRDPIAAARERAGCH